ncbi:MAG TPA: hypothetical protein VH475_23370, partial [Tepidisphaeraceae bacterium]
PDGFFGNNDNGAYNVKVNNLGQAAVYQPAGRGSSFDVFSFNTFSSQFDGRPSAASGNAGAADGFAQSGGNDNVIPYGARDHYVVQVDAILPNDRLDISSGTAADTGIFAPGSLSLFFRKGTAGVGGGTALDLFNGTTNTPAPLPPGTSFVNDDNWHNYAVDFDQPGHRVKAYIDGILRADIDLTTFAGGSYDNFSNATVGFGGSGAGDGFASYADNLMVGAPGEVPEPAGPCAIALFGMLVGRSRRR